MTRPTRYLGRMVFFLLIVCVAVAFLFPALRDAFTANAVLNGVILGALLVGIIHTFRNVTMLRGEARWLETFQRDDILSKPARPRLLAPMATMLGEQKGNRLSLSTIAMRSLLDGIAMRLDESREISRYMIGLLVFLGLLGTFWGLLGTVDSIGKVIGSLSAGNFGVSSAFEDLKSNLKAPLAGMGTAFSSSLFGLAGSLVLGFLALQAGQAQNRFYNDLEEWLSGQTKLGRGGIAGEGDQPVPAYIQALLEQTADGLENLQRVLARSEESRVDANHRIVQLGEAVAALADTIRTEQSLMLKLAEGHQELRPVLTKLSEMGANGSMPSEHYRTLEGLVGRIADELSSGREETVQEIRSEIRLLARTIAALAEEAEH
ncbi:MAG: flagellar motor protein MotA [Woeseiaceae bacterium]|nr:flagellar motor protein MotA [Woeseiaceae bacterium]